MQVQEINRDMVGHAVVLIEADDYPVYNGLIGTLQKDENKGIVFNPVLRSMPQGRTFHSIPLRPSDMIEPL